MITLVCDKKLLESSSSQDSPPNLGTNLVAHFSTKIAHTGLEFKNRLFYYSLITMQENSSHYFQLL